MKVIASSARKTLFVAVIGAYTLSVNAAHANPQSALDPYASISAPTAESQAAARAKAKNSKFGIPNLGLGLGKKKAEPAAKTAVEPVNTTQTMVSTPGGKSKAVKSSELAADTTTKVTDTALSDAPKDQGGGGGMLGGLKTISEGCSKTFKAATSGVVSGTKKVGSGIAGGAKASGSLVAKSAGLVGAGMKSTGEKVKAGTGAMGEKMAVIPQTIGKGFKSTGEMVKGSTQKIAGMGKKQGKSPIEHASKVEDIATRPSTNTVASEKPSMVASPVQEKTATSLSSQPDLPKSGGIMSKLQMPKFGFGKNKQTASKGQNPL